MDSSHYKPRSSVSEELPLKESVSGGEEFVSVSVSDVADPNLEGTAPPAGDSGNSTEGNHLLKPPASSSPVSASPVSSESDWETLDPGVLEEGGPKESPEKEEELLDTFDSQPGVPITVQPQAVTGQGGVTQGLVSGLEEDQYGLPLAIFTKVTALPSLLGWVGGVAFSNCLVARVTCACPTWRCSSITSCQTWPCEALLPGRPTSCFVSRGTSATPSLK